MTKYYIYRDRLYKVGCNTLYRYWNNKWYCYISGSIGHINILHNAYVKIHFLHKAVINKGKEISYNEALLEMI